MKWKPMEVNHAPDEKVQSETKFHSRFFQGWKLRIAGMHWMSALLLVMAFLLGKASILGELSPFAIAYFAVVSYRRKEIMHWAGCLLFVGSFFSPSVESGVILTEIAVFYLIQRVLEHFERSDVSYAPLLVLLSSFAVKLLTDTAQNNLTWYALMMAAVESVLSFVLTLIFLQAFPVFTLRPKHDGLRNEQMICLIILFASVMTGTVGWQVDGVSLEHVLSRYLILFLAMAGGAPLGASVGVVTGLILSLADAKAVLQMSLLAFAGMLAGLLKEAGKTGVAIGFLIGSSILDMYVGNTEGIFHSTMESALAVLFFMLTPQSAVNAVARYVPGTQEHVKFQYDYAKRVREVTAGRVEQFSEVFRQLAASFKQFAGDGGAPKKDERTEHYMDVAARKVCAGCWKRGQCWEDKFYQTYQVMTDMMTAVEAGGIPDKHDIPLAWRRACIKSEKVLELLEGVYQQYNHDQHWRKQILESRHLVAEQLSGVSRVMDDLADEIKKEGQAHDLQEEQIRSALEQLGLSIFSIEIVSLEEGNVEIEIIHQYSKGFDECRKIIAPLLSDILDETIIVKSEKSAALGEGYFTVIFASAKEFEVETGIAGAAKGGDLLSGDSFSTAELGNGKFAVAISDGMGNGERARAESSAALQILQQLLQSGMDEKLAIKSVNSVLLLRSSDEVFATVDVALIDLNTALTTFLKIGSTPSFIKRGSEVLRVAANNLPIGILQEIDIDLVSMQLKPGDTLIMMTDGLYDSPGPAVNKDMWMKRIIQEINVQSPQEIADCLLETVVRGSQGEIIDDMTVVVARLEKYVPEWKSVKWQGISRLERPKTVS